MPEVTGTAITILVYDRGMPVSVNLQIVHPRKLAPVRREGAPGAVGSAWGPALGKVWEFIRSQPGLRTDGHNIFLYHHPTRPGAPILCDFGVEATEAEAPKPPPSNNLNLGASKTQVSRFAPE